MNVQSSHTSSIGGVIVGGFSNMGSKIAKFASNVSKACPFSPAHAKIKMMKEEIRQKSQEIDLRLNKCTDLNNEGSSYYISAMNLRDNIDSVNADIYKSDKEKLAALNEIHKEAQALVKDYQEYKARAFS